MQSNDSLVLCLHCWDGLGWQRIGGVNSSSSIDTSNNDDSGNAQMTITTVAMTVAIDPQHLSFTNFTLQEY